VNELGRKTGRVGGEIPVFGDGDFNVFAQTHKLISLYPGRQGSDAED
jgi:hypothetical protein